MTDPTRSFAVASDEALVNLIRSARKRLVVIAPALTRSVAEALAGRFPDIGSLALTVILDADAEVYRLGFGDREALDVIRAAASNDLLDVREQPGVRIGVVIADDTTMVYSPVSRNIEAGSTSVEKPNAIVLGDAVADRLATAAGADNSETAAKPEVGMKALEPAKVEEMQADLEANPPRSFDITRRMNVFSSRVQYVEFSVENCRFTTREIPLPEELVGVEDDELKSRISSRIRAPFERIGKIKIQLRCGDVPIEVDDKWITKERKRIEDEYTFQINNYGRVILREDKQRFDEAIAQLKVIIEKYRDVLKEKCKDLSTDFQVRIVNEFAPRWERKPPANFVRWGAQPTRENIEAELKDVAQRMFDQAVAFEEPKVRILYKNVAPENVADSAFLNVLRQAMVKRGVPKQIIDSLFESGAAAPEANSFLGR